MPALVQLTEAEVFALATTSGNSSGQIGSWTVDRLTAFITSVPANNPCLLAFNEATTLLTDAGLNTASLTSLQLAQANWAMAYAVAYMLIKNDIPNAQMYTGENFTDTRTNVAKRTWDYFQMAGVKYSELGVADSANPYWINESYTNLQIVTPSMVTN